MAAEYFFGYGSLVNSRTHIYDPVHVARATGWRRIWCHTGARELAYLTVLPDPGCAIDGLVAPVDGDWSALDLRETAYDRLDANGSVSHRADHGPVAIYAIAPENRQLPDDDHPMLLSYLDVVLQGYLEVYGTGGADRFIATTAGWDTPVLDDRARPRYPRAQDLDDSQRAYVDAALASLACRVLV
ncbi:gamma-glutamylcyclotransferase family protein [Puniceibacterium sp. IMCC21224]|uniref:gamma-glutamylcyclotransferase family protein n=1 Tax=Puniceibacterium sp. IMCC21224 TaxID=1618204 RepID=UPI00064D9112|nr:gamma-glutamylcyclotransferase family protein [Puniceibacterium sp. IMCC21224]KMK68764.1 hypothetical protein IMCC21224_113650 [Puniceibacterium sp. IMCC21224]